MLALGKVKRGLWRPTEGQQRDPLDAHALRAEQEVDRLSLREVRSNGRSALQKFT
jgi:hypothetical protein